jgi:cell shape-determining protein MreD
VLTLIAGALLPWSWLLVLVVAARVAWRRRRPSAA